MGSNPILSGGVPPLSTLRCMFLMSGSSMPHMENQAVEGGKAQQQQLNSTNYFGTMEDYPSGEGAPLLRE